MNKRVWLGTLAVVVTGIGGAGLYASFDSYQPVRPDNVEIARARDGRGRVGREGPKVPNSASLFEFAPSGGQGMGTACACADVTGGDGETVTVSRASVAWCTKGNESSSIANGDLVRCASNKPRVMPGGTGSGALGVLVEGATVNALASPEAFDNVAWSHFHSAGDFTVTADAANGPCGAPGGSCGGADRVQFLSTSGGGYSALSQSPGQLESTQSASVYIKGVSGSGTLDLCLYDTVGTAYVCSSCAYVNTSWTRCKVENVAKGSVDATLILGNASAWNGGVARSANDVYLWGASWEAEFSVSATHPYVTSYTSSSRAADVISASISLTNATVSFGATWRSPAALASNVLLDLYNGSNDDLKLSIASSKVRSTFLIGGSSSTKDSAGNASASASVQAAGYYDGTNKAGCLAGTCTTGAASLTLPTGSFTLYIGADQAGANQADGVVKQVCVASDPTHCR